MVNTYNKQYLSHRIASLEECNNLLETEKLILVQIIVANNDDVLEEKTTLLLSKKLTYFEMQPYVQMTGAIIVSLENGVVIDEEFIKEYEDPFAYINNNVTRSENLNSISWICAEDADEEDFDEDFDDEEEDWDDDEEDWDDDEEDWDDEDCEEEFSNNPGNNIPDEAQ